MALRKSRLKVVLNIAVWFLINNVPITLAEDYSKLLSSLYKQASNQERPIVVVLDNNANRNERDHSHHQNRGDEKYLDVGDDNSDMAEDEPEVKKRGSHFSSYNSKNQYWRPRYDDRSDRSKEIDYSNRYDRSDEIAHDEERNDYYKSNKRGNNINRNYRNEDRSSRYRNKNYRSRNRINNRNDDDGYDRSDDISDIDEDRNNRYDDRDNSNRYKKRNMIHRSRNDQSLFKTKLNQVRDSKNYRFGASSGINSRYYRHNRNLESNIANRNNKLRNSLSSNYKLRGRNNRYRNRNNRNDDISRDSQYRSVRTRGSSNRHRNKDKPIQRTGIDDDDDREIEELETSILKSPLVKTLLRISEDFALRKRDSCEESGEDDSCEGPKAKKPAKKKPTEESDCEVPDSCEGNEPSSSNISTRGIVDDYVSELPPKTCNVSSCK